MTPGTDDPTLPDKVNNLTFLSLVLDPLVLKREAPDVIQFWTGFCRWSLYSIIFKAHNAAVGHNSARWNSGGQYHLRECLVLCPHATELNILNTRGLWSTTHTCKLQRPGISIYVATLNIKFMVGIVFPLSFYCQFREEGLTGRIIFYMKTGAWLQHVRSASNEMQGSAPSRGNEGSKGLRFFFVGFPRYDDTTVRIRRWWRIWWSWTVGTGRCFYTSLNLKSLRTRWNLCRIVTGWRIWIFLKLTWQGDSDTHLQVGS